MTDTLLVDESLVTMNDALDRIKTLNLANKDLHDQLRIAHNQINLLENQKNSQAAALAIANITKIQLEGTVKATRVQRDRLMEHEADAMVNIEIMEYNKNEEITKLEIQLKEALSSEEPTKARMVQMQASLDEVRSKFGDVQHKRKAAERELSESSDFSNSLFNALNWFIEESNGIKYNLNKRFVAATEHDLEADTIVKAYDIISASYPNDDCNYEGKLSDLLISIAKGEVA